MTDRERFEKLQEKWKNAWVKVWKQKGFLESKYRDWHNASMTDRRKVIKMQDAENAASDKFFEFLDTIATRNFRSGAPIYWILQNLTYDDAVTYGPMSCIPDLAWGCHESSLDKFRLPVRQSA